MSADTAPNGPTLARLSPLMLELARDYYATADRLKAEGDARGAEAARSGAFVSEMLAIPWSPE